MFLVGTLCNFPIRPCRRGEWNVERLFKIGQACPNDRISQVLTKSSWVLKIRCPILRDHKRQVWLQRIWLQKIVIPKRQVRVQSILTQYFDTYFHAHGFFFWGKQDQTISFCQLFWEREHEYSDYKSYTDLSPHKIGPGDYYCNC